MLNFIPNAENVLMPKMSALAANTPPASGSLLCKPVHRDPVGEGVCPTRPPRRSQPVRLPNRTPRLLSALSLAVIDPTRAPREDPSTKYRSPTRLAATEL